MKKIILAAALAATAVLTGCGGDPEAFKKGSVAEQWCKDNLIKPDNLIPGSKGEVRYQIQIQNCTKSVRHSYQSPSVWAQAKTEYGIK
jgi:hypothetical protein